MEDLADLVETVDDFRGEVAVAVERIEFFAHVHLGAVADVVVCDVELADAGDTDGIEQIVVRARFLAFDQR